MFCICIAIWLYICVVDDASKREVSTQPQLNVLPHPRLPESGCWCGLQCLSKLWYGCAVDYDRL